MVFLVVFLIRLWLRFVLLSLLMIIVICLVFVFFINWLRSVVFLVFKNLVNRVIGICELVFIVGVFMLLFFCKWNFCYGIILRKCILFLKLCFFVFSLIFRLKMWWMWCLRMFLVDICRVLKLYQVFFLVVVFYDIEIF